MKANEAPEKIYIFENPILDFTKLSIKQSDNDIEYTQTNAFIKKACKFLDKELPITDLSPSNMLDITFKVFDKESKKVFIENFKKYMEEYV